MNKSLYRFGAFFLGLIAACNLVQGIFQLLFGNQLFMQSSFIVWFLMMHTVSITGVIVVQKYYYHQKYWAAFYTGIIAALAGVCYAVVISIMLLSRTLYSYQIPTLLISLAITIIYAIALIFSGTRKKAWLKVAGAYILVVGLILVTSIAGPLVFKNVQINGVLKKIPQWASIAGSLISIPFMMHFLREIKLLKADNADSSDKESSDDILITVRSLALVIVLIIGGFVATEGYSGIYWGKRNFESTKALARLFEARIFVNSKGDTLRYRLLKPLNYDPQKQYPLVVSLPFGGQPGTDTIRQLEGAAAAEILSTDINRKKYPAFIFVPNCPAGSGWGGIANYPSVDTLVYKAITALDTVFSIDAKRRYVTGISRGGYGSWHFICTRPDLFAAAIPVCGGEDPKFAPGIVGVAVWAFHGAKDQNVPVAGSRGMIEAMRKSGQKPKYTEYPNEGHNIWYQVSTTPGLWDWLFAQKRD